MTTPGARRPNLRQGLDRDVYQILKKLEDSNDGKPLKSVSAVYDAIKRSNSSLSRQKKRPLEDSIDRVLQFRKEELGDLSDSEAAIDEPPPKPDDDRYLLNRQMTKHWHQNSTAASQNSVAQGSNESSRAVKKRRLQEDGEDRANDATTSKGAMTDTETGLAEKSDKEKTPSRKTQKPSRYMVEHPSEALQLGGVDKIYTDLLQQTNYLLKWPKLYATKAWRRVPGILLSGPPGIGKRSLIRSLAARLEVPIVSLTGCLDDSERMERSLNDAVEEAMRLAPCIIFIEQLDWYMSKPGGSGYSESHRRTVTQFMRQMRRLETDQDKDRHVLAMATTSKITDVDPAVLKTGFFERTVQMRIPDLAAREDILKLVTTGVHLADNVNFTELAKIMHGFVGADIVNVMTLAQQVAAERIMQMEEYRRPLFNLQMPITNPSADLMELTDQAPPEPFPEPPDVPLTQEDFKAAIKDFTPSLRKEGFTVIPNVTWTQVGALQDVREQVHMSIIGPIKDPDLYYRSGLSRPAGCLLWGPPGCGKTLVAQAVANEAQASFILINGPELLNKYVGESERAVRELFNRARSSTPCIIFFDEMDSLVPKRENASTEASTRVVNALLTELDGARGREGVYVIGTTNRPDMIDPAMLRPGRLDVRLFIDLPTPDERVDILRAIYRTNHMSPTPAELEHLEPVARDTRCSDFSGADLEGLRIKAAQSSLKRWWKKEKSEPEIDKVDWERALSTTHRSVLNPESYRKLDAKLGKAN
ncbi:Ribosome biogenesis ATPase RIX7 [Fusarium albosuccineum]|uniref:Peroxisomal ATPase PEX1 n=2 Tax=Fusarium albosuccineum TaxID=1237068 RepID=A0A8H4L2B6_9HYPO|nr:Ribosome biogenesis ATPase RIX7 [Fusarium albosuccineum]